MAQATSVTVPILARLLAFADPAPDEVCLDLALGRADLVAVLGPRVGHLTAVDLTPVPATTAPDLAPAARAARRADLSHLPAADPRDAAATRGYHGTPGVPTDLRRGPAMDPTTGAWNAPADRTRTDRSSARDPRGRASGGWNRPGAPNPAGASDPQRSPDATRAPGSTDPQGGSADSQEAAWDPWGGVRDAQDASWDRPGGSTDPRGASGSERVSGRWKRPGGEVAADALGRMPTVSFGRGAGRRADRVARLKAHAGALPCRDGVFSLVTCRSALYRLGDPQGALHEMLRVCRPGGRVVIADLVRPNSGARERDLLERRRDPEHPSTPSIARVVELVTQAGGDVRALEVFTLERPVEGWLGDAAETPGAQQLRTVLLDEVDGGPRTGAKPRVIGGELWITQRWIHLAASPISSRG